MLISMREAPNASSWYDADLSIQDGINAAGNGDEFLLDERDHEAYPTVIDASGFSLSAVTMNSVSNARLDGFWVTGGDATTSGGGNYVLFSDNTNAIVDCTI